MRRTHSSTRPSTRLALLVPALVLALTACVDQPEEANDNGPQEQPTRPAPTENLRTPEANPSAGLTVENPGETANPTAAP